MRNIAIINDGEIVENTSVKALLKTFESRNNIFGFLIVNLPDGGFCWFLVVVLSKDASSIEVEVVKGHTRLTLISKR